MLPHFIQVPGYDRSKAPIRINVHAITAYSDAQNGKCHIWQGGAENDCFLCDISLADLDTLIDKALHAIAYNLTKVL